ncbi:MAG: glycoside hydrolase family 2 TIM barrel-domain containing protein [Rhodothermales bacterium]
MNHTRILAIVLGCAFGIGHPGVCQAQDTSRSRQSLNDGWSFRLDSSGASWESVNLPHTWNVSDAFDKSRTYYRGVGEYRRAILRQAEARSAGSHTRWFVLFEGANQIADVSVNNVHVGQHIGGYTRFVFDVTDYLRYDGTDSLTVRVDNRYNEDVPPLSADFTFYGGIYRDVWLIGVDDVHVDLEDYASSGMYITTMSANPDSARIKVAVRVANDSGTAVTGRARLTLGGASSNADDATSHTEELRFRVGAGDVVTLSKEFLIRNPRLWAPLKPELYQATARVLVGGSERDAVTETFGIRTLKVTPDGMLINGVDTRLIGTNRHQDRMGYGNALPNELHPPDIETVVDLGMNFLRLAHYPQDPVVLAETDSLGLAVWQEIPVVNRITQSEEFYSNAERMIVEMVRQNYNHPSIVIWGIMNEVLLRKPNPIPEGYFSDVHALAERLNGAVKREDPRRPTALAVSGGEIYDGTGVSSVTDILGMNLYFGWYVGRFESFGPFLDTLHVRHPDRPLFVSEYGAGSDERIHAHNPRAFDFSSEYAIAYHRSSFEQILARPYLVGTAVWATFDFGSATRNDTKFAINQKGLFTFDRVPKDQARYYEAVLAPEPRIEIERDHLKRVLYDGNRIQPVVIYTNADSVVVRRDDFVVSALVSNAAATVAIPFVAGDNVVTATGYWNGTAGLFDSASFDVHDTTSCDDEWCGLAINIGSLEVLASDGWVYAPESEISGTLFSMHVPGVRIPEPKTTPHAIRDTVDDPLFQTCAVIDDLTMGSLAVPAAGIYDVTLGFARHETAEGAAEAIRISLNGNDEVEAVFDADATWRAGVVSRSVEASSEIDYRLRPVDGSMLLCSVKAALEKE